MDSPASTTPAAPAVPASPGAALKAARLAQGLSIEDISRQLKLSATQINAIEADDHARLPGPVFARGFIRSYARLLKLDSESLLAPRPSASPPPAPIVVNVLPPAREVPPVARESAAPAPAYDTASEIPREAASEAPREAPPAVSPAIQTGKVQEPAHDVTVEASREVPRDLPSQPRESPRPEPREVVRETIIEDRLRGGSRDTLEPSPFRRMPLWLGSIAAVVLGLAYYEFVVNAPVNAPTTAPVAPVAPSTAKAGNAEGAGADAAPPLGAVPATAVSATVAPTASESVTPAVEAPARPAALALKKSGDPAGGAASGLHFVFSGESWVEVRDGEGNIVFSRTNEAGSERRVQGKPPLSVVVGGSSRVQLSYNGNPIDLLAYTREDVARLRLE